MSLSQIELVWVRVLHKMGESKMAEFKMAAIIKLRENEWVLVRLNYFESEFCAKWLNARWQNSRWPPSSSWVRMNEWSFFCAKWLNARWQNSRWLPSSSWVRMNEFESDWISLSQSFVQNRWIQGRVAEFKMAAIIKLCEKEWVWVRLN